MSRPALFLCPAAFIPRQCLQCPGSKNAQGPVSLHIFLCIQWRGSPQPPGANPLKLQVTHWPAALVSFLLNLTWGYSRGLFNEPRNQKYLVLRSHSGRPGDCTIPVRPVLATRVAVRVQVFPELIPSGFQGDAPLSFRGIW